jgi:hypothetical protein
MRGSLALVLGLSLLASAAEARTPTAPMQKAATAAMLTVGEEAPLPMGAVSSSCTFKGKRLYGKVQVVTSFPDIKVQVVSSFPDLKVQKVTSFPDSCGKWQFVTSFPDFKVQFVTSFPDVKIQYVTSFPGVR